MLEFTPMDFFAVSRPAAASAVLTPEVDLVKHDNEESGTTLFGEDSPLSHSSTATSKKASSSSSSSSSSSDNHNMVKQLVITIKQMVGKYIPEIGCSHTAKEIISEVWSVFESTRNPSKEILKAMFNKEVNLRQVEKVRLGSIVRDYGSYEFLNAMDDLRMDIVFRMRSQSLKSHMFGRNIQKKERLEAYVQYFVEEELKSGIVSSRFSEAAGKRMDQILQNNKCQAECIDYYFDNSNEAFVRFAS